MSAKELLQALRDRGVEVIAAGDKIRWRPKDAVTADEQREIVANKADLLVLLTPPDAVPNRGDLEERSETDALIATLRKVFDTVTCDNWTTAQRNVWGIAREVVEDYCQSRDLERLREAVVWLPAQAARMAAQAAELAKGSFT